MGCGSPRCRSQASPAVCQATGDRNKLIMIWDAATCKRLHIFTGHRDAVSVSWGHWARCLWGQAAVSSSASLTAVPCLSICPQGLSFRKGTHQLYSASHDRCVKVWDVAENAYVETL